MGLLVGDIIRHGAAVTPHAFARGGIGT